MSTLLAIGLANALCATALALLATVVGKRCRRPALNHGLWLLVLVKLLTPPIFVVTVSWLAESQGPAPVPGPSLAAIAGWLWLGGSASWFGWATWHHYQFHRLLRFAQPGGVELQNQARRLAGRLGLTRCPTVWLLPGLLPPMMWSAFSRPRVFFPSALLARLDDEQVATLLAHELAHVRRRDHWVRHLELLATILYWWCPLVWWVRRQIRVHEEECCDARVVAELPAPTYAAAILETVAFLAEPCPPPPVLTSALGRVNILKRRLTLIIDERTPRERPWAAPWAALWVAAVAFLPVPMLAPGFEASTKGNPRPGPTASANDPAPASPNPLGHQLSPSTRAGAQPN